jgi:SAM-dependent methyltransferase
LSSVVLRGLLQSPEEWEVRNRVLAESLSQLAKKYLRNSTGRGLDVGCQYGAFTDRLNAYIPLAWEGIDPILTEQQKSPQGATLRPAAADSIPCPDCHFDCLILANVFEHIPPDLRYASFKEMHRVLQPGGIIVGQIPNPHFPIESHSRLPFMGWLPISLREKYRRLAAPGAWEHNSPWEHNFFAVTTRHLKAEAARAGFQVVTVENFNYPVTALPKAVRPLAVTLSVPMKRFPWAWQFVLRRPAEDS